MLGNGGCWEVEVLGIGGCWEMEVLGSGGLSVFNFRTFSHVSSTKLNIVCSSLQVAL